MFDKIPIGWQWFSWISFLRYSWGAMMVDNYSGKAVGEANVFIDSSGTPVNVLEFYGLDEGPIMDSVWINLGLLFALMMTFFALGMAAVVFIRHEKR